MQASPYDLATELARPVSRGDLPLAHAYAACLVSALAAERAGPYAAPDIFRLQKHLLDQAIDKATAVQDVTAMRIKALLRPMIARRAPVGALLAEAHGENGTRGFPFTEEQVTDIVRTEVWHALPRR